jgi:hypothetical protein
LPKIKQLFLILLSIKQFIMAKDKINKTNACRLLDQKKIAYELIPYEVDENDLGAQHIADQLEKTLIRYSRPWY